MKTMLKIFTAILLLNLQVNAQEVNLHLPKQKFEITGMQYAGLGLMFIGGVADGYNQVVRHHYYRFAEMHPGHNPLFWGEKQWLNKWKLDDEGQIIPNPKTGLFRPDYVERFWGSSRWFVSVTDAHHLTREIDKLTTISGSMLLVIGEKKPWWHYAIMFAGGVAARSAGFYIVHDVIYK